MLEKQILSKDVVSAVVTNSSKDDWEESHQGKKSHFLSVFELVCMGKWPRCTSVPWAGGRMGQHSLIRLE